MNAEARNGPSQSVEMLKGEPHTNRKQVPTGGLPMRFLARLRSGGTEVRRKRWHEFWAGFGFFSEK